MVVAVVVVVMVVTVGIGDRDVMAVLPGANDKP